MSSLPWFVVRDLDRRDFDVQPLDPRGAVVVTPHFRCADRAGIRRGADELFVGRLEHFLEEQLANSDAVERLSAVRAQATEAKEEIAKADADLAQLEIDRRAARRAVGPDLAARVADLDRQIAELHDVRARAAAAAKELAA